MSETVGMIIGSVLFMSAHGLAVWLGIQAKKPVPKVPAERARQEYGFWDLEPRTQDVHQPPHSKCSCETCAAWRRKEFA